MKSAEIIAVGSELLTPDRIDTNSLWLTSELLAIGIQPKQKLIIGDDLALLTKCIEAALQRSDVVICTGGLGPTLDDLTRDAIAKALGIGLVRDEKIIAELREKFRTFGRTMTQNNERQAMLPEGALSLPNPKGTAPGILIQKENLLVALPGPPREMKAMFADHVLPRLLALAGESMVKRRSFFVTGLGESAMDDIIAPIYREYANPVTMTLFTPLGLEVHLSATGPDAPACDALLCELGDPISLALGRYIYSETSDSLANAVVQLAKEASLTLASCENVTGGLLAQRLSDLGLSDVYLGGLVLPLSANRWGFSKALDSLGAEIRAQTTADIVLLVLSDPGPDAGGRVVIGFCSSEGWEANPVEVPGEGDIWRSRLAQAGLDKLRRKLLDYLKK